MVDITGFKAAFEGLKATKDVVKSALTIKQDVAIAEKAHEIYSHLNDVQEKLMSLQSEYMTMSSLKDDLEKQLIALKQWNEDKQRYKAYTLPAGTFVYILNPANSNGEPEHYLCPQCYQDNVKAILHPHDISSSPAHTTLRCPKCKVVYFNERLKSTIAFSSGRERGCW